MKKILIVILILTLVSCQSNKFKTSIDLAEYIVELSMGIPFSDYSNMTATGGDLKRRMKARYKLFKPYLKTNAIKKKSNSTRTAIMYSA